MGLLLKQKRILAFLIIFVTTTVALPFAALLPSQQVSAATYTDSSIKTEAECKALGGTFTSSYQGSSLETRCSNLPVRIDTEAKIIANAAWLAECFAGSIANQPQYSASEIQDANLLLAGQKVVGHIIARDDGKLDCGDGANVTSKLRAIGYTDMVGALVDIGCRKQGNSGTYDCTNTNSSKTQIYQKFVKKKYSDAGLTDVNKYYIALETFRVGCTASPITSPTEADRNAANSNSGETYNVTEVGADGTKTSAIYTSEKDRGDNISTLNGSAGWESDGSFECRTLASMTNSYADAYANWAKNNSILAQQVATAAQAANSGSDAEACAIEGIGWIVCPVATFLAQATDAVYGLVEKLLIFTVQSDSYGAFDSQNPVFLVWSGIRNLANIAFIFAFFMIIFSQATSIGIGNYGIKKMLPRLIVAAILVNLSYYICVFAVDVSNILGAGVDGIIESTPLSQIEGPENNWVEIIGSVLSAGTVGVGAVAAAAAISGTSFWAVLASALPFMVTALFAALTALVVLVARQALLIILIVVAPLAFVAYILPNTESFFEKWRKAFTTLLLFYPIVAVVFSGAQVAAAVLRTTRPDDVLIMIASLAVQTFPLFALPFLLKFSGGVLGKIAGVVNNPNKGPFDKLRKRAEITRDTAQARARTNALERPRPDYTGKRFSRSRNALANANIFSARRNAQAAQDRERALNEAKQAETKAGGEYYASRVVGDEKYARKMAGGTMFKAPSTADLQRVQTTALAQEKKAFNDRVGLYQTSYSLNPKGADTFEGGYLEQQMLEGVRNNNREQTAAAINRMSTLGLGGRDALRRVLTNVTINDEDMRQTVINSIYEDNFPGLVGKAGDVAKGGFDKTTNTWSTDGALAKLGSEQLATQDLTVLQTHKASIAPHEAYRIVHDAELSSKVQNTEALAILKEVADSFTPSTPSGQIIIPRGTPSTSNPRSTPTQDERDAGGRFNGPS